MSDWKTLLQKAQAHAKAAGDIAKKYPTMTSAQRTEYQAEYDAAVRAKTASDQAKLAAEDQALLKTLAGSDDAAPDPEAELVGHHDGPIEGTRWSKAVIGRLAKAANQVGVKALLTGQITTPPTVEISPLPDKPVTMLDLIPKAKMDAATSSYLRQSVQTQNAAVVADHATKPTSVYTFAEVDSKARVIAHLSEPFPLRYLSDYNSLAEILDTQMINGVLAKLEDRIVNGTGTGEDFAGILSTTGVLDVPFSSNMITTVRKARTVLGKKGEKPNGWVFHPDDVEVLDLMRENGATGGFLLDSAAYDSLFGQGTVRIESLAVPAGTALFADWSKMRLLVREGAHTLAATQAGDLFAKNEVMLRSEGRFEIEVHRPQAVAVVDLTGA